LYDANVERRDKFLRAPRKLPKPTSTMLLSVKSQENMVDVLKKVRKVPSFCQNISRLVIAPRNQILNGIQKPPSTPTSVKRFKSNVAKRRKISPDEQETYQRVAAECFEHLGATDSSWFSRFITSIFSNKKIIFVMFVHMVLTAIIWQHFFLIKYTTQKDK
jgi:hypothetical protein